MKVSPIYAAPCIIAVFAGAFWFGRKWVSSPRNPKELSSLVQELVDQSGTNPLEPQLPVAKTVPFFDAVSIYSNSRLIRVEMHRVWLGSAKTTEESALMAIGTAAHASIKRSFRGYMTDRVFGPIIRASTPAFSILLVEQYAEAIEVLRELATLAQDQQALALVAGL